jgi:cholesterol transport system auxiliary component
MTPLTLPTPQRAMTGLPRPSHRRAAAAAAVATAAALLLSACGSLPLPDKPVRPQVYDFGPISSQQAATPTGVPIAMAQFDTSRALDSTAIVYRLAYSDAQVPHPYAGARWSMPPAQLLHQRVRSVLAQTHPVVFVGEGHARIELRVELDEFSHVFDSPSQSHGLVRVHVTALAPNNRGDRLLGQRSFAVTAPAPTPDAPGGVKALTQASAQVAQDMANWVNALPQPASR